MKFIYTFIRTVIIFSVVSIGYDLIISNKTFLEIDFIKLTIVGVVFSSAASISAIYKK